MQDRPQLTNVEIQHYIKLAEKLVSELIPDERIELLCIPLALLPTNASLSYREIHRTLSDSRLPNAAWNVQTYADFLQTALRKLAPFLEKLPPEIPIDCISPHLDRLSVASGIEYTYLS
jgi:hypothetical protein